MRNVKKLSLFVLMPALVSTAAVADIHYVNPGESIQAAIDASDPGDEVEVAPGTYTEAIDFIGKAIRLYSSGGPDVTIIDGTVRCTNSEGPETFLEGFTITGGNYGMWNNDSSPIVINCTFTGNAAVFGGGMCNNESSPTVIDCTFINNTADRGGGGMYNSGSSPTVTNCTFSGNNAWDEGGGMFNFNSNPTVTNCTFTGNTCIYGGGLCNYSSDPTVINCIFSGNTATFNGGGMYNSYDSIPTVTNCIFILNTGEYGGGMYNSGSSPTVTNCTFSSNTAAYYGGGMYNYDNSGPTVTNCILWADSPKEIFDGDGLTTVTYSDVQGGWAGTGNIDTDPMFADADRRLLDGSPCIDAGNDAAVPFWVTTDLDGNPRIQGVCVDMGAFESGFIIDFYGWVWMDGSSDFGYSYNEDDLLYFVSFWPVWYYNTATSQWGEEGPAGWTYVNWPYLYESATSTTMFALPPESGLWVYHFRFGQWTVSPRIIP